LYWFSKNAKHHKNSLCQLGELQATRFSVYFVILYKTGSHRPCFTIYYWRCQTNY